ncbi:uncharacterized protein LOC132229806 isoform X2 [Myotis daubentonii]|uniref:uncharacterized protein LOC132229806 isoform X2 n=1 Tax=Myotis daubentonii TaxID=98922 RepID=UPI0028736E5C|nr:uncharacterized protein LOC132229806 isoform X2 [Myotis daubentonii]
MAEGSSATAAAASAPSEEAAGRGEGRQREEGGGRAGGEGAGGRGKGRARRRRRRASPPPRLGAPRARSAAARPGAPPYRASASCSGRASSRPPGRRSASPFLLHLRLLPHKYQLLTPSPDLAAAAAAATLRSSSPRETSALARPTPPRSYSPACPLAPPPLPIGQPFATEAPPTLPGSSRIGAGGTAPARAGWPAARDVTAPSPLVARLPPSAVQQWQNPSPQARAALGIRASPRQPLPQELELPHIHQPPCAQTFQLERTLPWAPVPPRVGVLTTQSAALVDGSWVGSSWKKSHPFLPEPHLTAGPPGTLASL